MAGPLFNTKAHKTSPETGLSSHAGFRVLRYSIMALGVIFSIMCAQTGTAYVAADVASDKTQAWFDGDSLPAPGEIASIQQQLETINSVLIDDAQVKLALARLYIVRGQTDTSKIYYEAARKVLSDVGLIQPSHYEALALQIFLDDFEDTFTQASHTDLVQVLNVGPFEKAVQQLVGPVLIKRWGELPPDIHQLAEPLIKSALRERSTKEILFHYMQQYHTVTPFMCCSPNRETSAQLRVLEATTPNAVVQ